MFKKIVSVLLCLVLFCGSFGGIYVKAEETEILQAEDATGIPQLPFEVMAKGAVVMEAESGRVLFEQNAHDRRAMASTTKILTSLIAMEQPNQDEYFTVDTAAIHVEGSSMGLKDGDQVSLKTLEYGMLLPSGNDAANAAAVRIAGSIPAFADMMNERAQLIGMENSHFVTPSGLDEDGHYSTAYDMALLAREAIANPDFREIAKCFTARIEFGNPPYARTLKNHNKLLNLYDYTIGVKTGYTGDAGRCLVTAAEKDGMTLIVVTLGASDDFNTHKNLYEFFYENYEMSDISGKIGEISIPLIAGREESVKAVPTQALAAPLCENEYENLTKVVKADNFLYAPVKKEDIIGTVEIYSGDKLVYQSPIRAVKEYELNKKNLSLWERLFGK